MQSNCNPPKVVGENDHNTIDELKRETIEFTRNNLLTPQELKELFDIYVDNHGIIRINLLEEVKTKLVDPSKNKLYIIAEEQVISEKPGCFKYKPEFFKYIYKSHEFDKETREKLGLLYEEAVIAKRNEDEKYQKLLQVEETLDQVAQLLLSITDTTKISFTAEDQKMLMLLSTTDAAENQKKLITLLSSLNDFFKEERDMADADICSYSCELEPLSKDDYQRAMNLRPVARISQKMVSLNDLFVQIDKMAYVCGLNSYIQQLLKQFHEKSFEHSYAKHLMKKQDSFNRPSSSSYLSLSLHGENWIKYQNECNSGHSWKASEENDANNKDDSFQLTRKS